MAHHTLTASELTAAVLDPDWRARWCAGERPSTRSFAPPGTPRAMSLRFHKEAEALVRWLTAPASLAAAARLDTADSLLDHLWASSLQAVTDKLFEKGRGEEAQLFTARLRTFCTRLIDLRRRATHFENWQDVFVGAEQELARIPVRIGDDTVEVRARVDAIRIHPERHLEVVDYKLSQGDRQRADLVQLAIYAHLLPIWRPGCGFSGTLEYYLPDFGEVPVSRDDLADIFSGMVAPVLREMFPSARPATAAGAAPTAAPASGPAAAHSDPGAVGRAVVAAFRGFNLEVEVAGVIEGPQLVRLRLAPAPGVKVSSLANRAEDLQIPLSLSVPPLIRAGKGHVILDLPRPEPKPCLLKEALAGRLAATLKSPVAFPIGIGVEGDPVVADFADPNTCHALVAGSTGSGKSEWLKALVASLVLRNTPAQVRIALIDPKILTFAGVEDSPWLWRPPATTLADAMAILRAATAEMDARYQRLKRGGFANLAERIAAGETDIPFLVLIFDEFADLVLAGRDEKREFEALVARLAGMGRAAGIHLVLATQRPDRTIVTGLVKANLPLKVCLKVANAVNALIVLDEPGAESLYGKGDLLCDFGKGLVRAQGLFVPQAEFLAAVAPPRRGGRRG
ncbi:DNA translocase FtsK [Rhodoplanes sp. TEM]|uniref:DNA translocase FtsK n=1 Tax=Rhodoplanes tepidamans TaxID=200616 RepID=A0ABT5JJ65_RHOTP|nr:MULTISPECIES: DNA translocase FtsK [Rhodoplanes]MDC7789050.1 DNA translocase FtsK [Rhodoplanes tepidamans]MDC7987339.1 DNA translocase FtsK [Rhodoplanes sp. TEM]MDQ0354933.1 S-DNA-T family DNA segregation ATPase FtsK/SpoIIIE [Rhodoplanes tepidamans]